jgi:Ca-activated chloride channel family protein
MTFAHERVLWLLLVFPPALIAFFWWSWRKKQELMTQFIQARLLPTLTEGISPARRKLRLSLVIFAVAGLIVALARPQWGSDWEQVKVRGLDIIVAIDVSKSMLAEDISPNRLGRAKLAALDLMNQSKSDRLGLVAFAGDAFLVSPLTVDESVFRQSVEALDVTTISEPGTALAEAIDTATKAFKEDDNHKALILLTDGEDQDSGAVEAAKKAGANGLTIITIGVGSAEGELLRIRDAKGRTDYIRDEQGNVVKSKLNEKLLREIAEATSNGLYVPLQGARTMEQIYAKRLAPMPKSESNEKLVKRLHEQYHWPLAFAILALLAEIVIPERKRGRGRDPASGKRIARAILLLVLAGVFSSNGFGSPSSALRDLNEGRYDQALRQYEDLLKTKGGDPRLKFNAGIAAYRGGKYDVATKQFNEALSSPDLELQKKSYYNRGNTLFQMSDRESDPKKKMETLESSLKDFQNSLGLDPRDADAKYNYDFVKKRIEELKQQQQQQQKSDDKKDDQKKDQDKNQEQNQQSQNQKDQKKQDQEKGQQSQDSQGNKSDQGKQQDQGKPPDDKKSPEEQARQKTEEQEKQKAQAAQAQQGKEGEKKEDETSEASATKGQMTAQEAKQLLDSLKGDENVIPLKPKQKAKERTTRLRDW